MISVIEAHRIGKAKCVELLGRDNISRMKDTACVAYGTEFVDGKLLYFVGITDESEPADSKGKINTGHTQYKYRALVDVFQNNGEVKIVDLVSPVNITEA